MKDKRSIFLLLPVILLLLVLLVYTGTVSKDEIKFVLLDGNVTTLSEIKGRPVLINFWATTCAPCRKEMPDLANLYQELSPRGLEMLGVAMSYDRPDHVLKFKQRLNIPYRISLDLDGEVAEAFSVEAIPATLLLSAEGKEVYRHLGVIDATEVRNKINQVLSEMES